VKILITDALVNAETQQCVEAIAAIISAFVPVHVMGARGIYNCPDEIWTKVWEL
jgi:hypothetical protein